MVNRKGYLANLTDHGQLCWQGSLTIKKVALPEVFILNSAVRNGVLGESLVPSAQYGETAVHPLGATAEQLKMPVITGFYIQLQNLGL